MKRLLQIELIKLWNNRASKILIYGYFILLTGIALIAAIKFDIAPIKFHLAEQGIFNFPYIWHFNTFVAALLKIFLAIIIVSMMSNEYTYKTIKQNLIDGLSKKEFIASKFLTVVLFSIVSTVFVGVISLILGSIYSDYTEWGHFTDNHIKTMKVLTKFNDPRLTSASSSSSSSSSEGDSESSGSSGTGPVQTWT